MSSNLYFKFSHQSLVIGFALILGFSTLAIGEPVNPDFGKHGLVLYAETLGHNYYGFWKSEKGLWSVNGAYRYRIGETESCVQISAGWGMYKNSRFQYVVGFSDGFVHFFSSEITAQCGRNGHYAEAGVGVTTAFGEQLFLYYKPGGGGPSNEQWVTRAEAVEVIPRLGYVYASGHGIFFRIAYTPHLFPKTYKSYEDYFLQEPDWYPVGVSLGWIFHNK